MNRDGKMKEEDATAMVVEMILNKESWTGRDLGYLAIANAATKFQQAIRNEKTITPLVDSTRLQEMVDTLSGNDKELKIYGNYTAMYSWIMKQCQTAGLMMLKAKMECQYLSSIIKEAIMVEDAIKCAKEYLIIKDSIQKILRDYSFDSIVVNKVDNIILSKSTLIKSLYYVFGVNIIIDLIARAHKLPPVSMFKVPNEDVCNSIDFLIKKTLELKDKSSIADYLSENNKEARIDFINSFLSNIDHKGLQPPKENKDAVYRSIKDFRVFASRQETKKILSLVCEL